MQYIDLKEVKIMQKKVFLYVLSLLFLASLVFAAHSTTVSISPGSSYETVRTTYTLTVQNNAGSSAINNVNISLNGYNFNEVVFIPFGWSFSINGNTLIFLTSSNQIGPLPGDLGRSFIFNATASLVNSNTANTWNVLTRDIVNGTFANSVSVTSLNDSIPPLLSNPTPNNTTIIKNETRLFTVGVTELETGILDGIIQWDFYTAYGVLSNLTNSQGMSCSSTSCSTTLSLNSPPAGKPYLAYIIIVRDNALNSNEITRFIAVDSYFPIVNLTSPDGILTNGQGFSLSFDSSDNSFGFDPQLNRSLRCELYVDSVLNNYSYTTISGIQVLNINTLGLLDGPHSWYVSCTDKAGYISGTGTRTFTLDTTGPNITLISPLNNSVISNLTTIDFSINDLFSGVSSAWYVNGTITTLLNSSYDTISNWTEGLNTITVYSNDTLNNLASKAFSFIVDSSAPTIDLSGSLADGSNMGNPVIIPFAVSDTYSQNMACTLAINGNTSTLITNGSGNYLFNLGSLANGTYQWTITCTDQGNNTATSANRNLNIDALPPNVTLTSPLSSSNSLTGNMSFNYTVYDVATISNCSLYINNQVSNSTTIVDNTATTNNTLSYSLNSSNSAYNWFVSCYDIYNNQGNSTVNQPIFQVYYDNIAPTITLGTTTVTDITATLNWNVSEATSEIIYYWINQSTSVTPINLSLSGSLTKSYTISRLTSSTIYYYNITATDQFSNLVRTTTLSFTTSATPSSNPSGGGGGGGGGGSPACYPNWTTLEWSKCSINGLQTRTVTDINKCDTNQNIPTTIQTCTYTECITDLDCVSGYTCLNSKCEKIQSINETEIEVPPITGFSILNLFKGNIKYAGIILLIIIALIILHNLYGNYRRQRDNVNLDSVKQSIKEGRIRKG